MVETEAMLSTLNTVYRLLALGFAVSLLCAVLLFFRLRIPDVLAYRRNGYGGRGQHGKRPGKKHEFLSAGYVGDRSEKEKTRRGPDNIPHEIPVNPQAVERVKKTLDSVFFTQEVCVEAPQTSAGSHRRNHLRDFASGVSAQERFDMVGRGDTIRLDMLPAEGLTTLHRQKAGDQKKCPACENGREVPFEITVNTAIVHTSEII